MQPHTGVYITGIYFNIRVSMYGDGRAGERARGRAPFEGVVQQGDYDDGQDSERRVAGGGVPPGDAAAQEDRVAQLVQALHLALELGHLRQRADALPCARMHAPGW